MADYRLFIIYYGPHQLTRGHTLAGKARPRPSDLGWAYIYISEPCSPSCGSQVLPYSRDGGVVVCMRYCSWRLCSYTVVYACARPKSLIDTAPVRLLRIWICMDYYGPPHQLARGHTLSGKARPQPSDLGRAYIII